MWMDERELKRQRRKQSNRESARRSRLRKQAECEELGGRVDALSTENVTLRAELDRLKEACAALNQDNSMLSGKIKALDGDATAGKGDGDATDGAGEPSPKKAKKGERGGKRVPRRRWRGRRREFEKTAAALGKTTIFWMFRKTEGVC